MKNLDERRAMAASALKEAASQFGEDSPYSSNYAFQKVKGLCGNDEVFTVARSMMATVAMRRGEWTVGIWFDRHCSSPEDAAGFLLEAGELAKEKPFGGLPQRAPYTHLHPGKLA